MDTQEINYKKILVINLGGIGDILLSTPVLKALKSAFEKARVDILTVPRVYELTKDMPFIDHAYIFHLNLGGIFRNLTTLLRLRKQRYDLAINMRTLVSERSAKKIKLMLDIISPQIKAGRDTEGRGYFFDIKINESDASQRYEMEYDIELAELLGVKVIDRKINFDIAEESKGNVSKMLEKSEVKEHDILIGIHPGGKPSHRWPLENFRQVIRQLGKEENHKFVITGDKKELSLAKSLANAFESDVINLCGKLNINELGALIERCNVFIANDTGIIHIAAVLNVPLVAIFGPGFLGRYDPRQISDKAVVLCEKADCAPCNRIKCKDLKCLEAIAIDDVLTAINKFLD